MLVGKYRRNFFGRGTWVCLEPPILKVAPELFHINLDFNSNKYQ